MEPIDEDTGARRSAWPDDSDAFWAAPDDDESGMCWIDILVATLTTILALISVVIVTLFVAALLAAAFAGPARGQTTPSRTCLPAADIDASAMRSWGEARLLTAAVSGSGQAVLLIYAAPDGSTWIAIIVSGRAACIAAHGTGWVFGTPAPAGTPG